MLSPLKTSFLLTISPFTLAGQSPLRAAAPDTSAWTAAFPSVASFKAVTTPLPVQEQQQPQQPYQDHSSPVIRLGHMDVPSQQFAYTPRNASANADDDRIYTDAAAELPSFYDSVVLNGDFATGDTSGWSVESPSPDGKWDARVTSSAASGSQQPLRTALRVSVPPDSYVMLFQDVDYNSTSTFTLPSTPSDFPAYTTAQTIPFARDDSYIFTFDYRFAASSCAVGASLYYGVVSAEDLVDLEGDLSFGAADAGTRWRSFRGRVRASTEWGSLYLYFMTKERGGCVFEVADLGLWRVVGEGRGV